MSTEPREQRRNEIAALVRHQWAGHVPLSVRYAAADAADALVAAWFEAAKLPSSPLSVAEMTNTHAPGTTIATESTTFDHGVWVMRWWMGVSETLRIWKL